VFQQQWQDAPDAGKLPPVAVGRIFPPKVIRIHPELFCPAHKPSQTPTF
jgi:hypothetical protein